MTRFVTALTVVTFSASVGGCGTAQESPPIGNSIDRAFMAAMIPHHESAIEMAQIAREGGRSDFVSSLAADIIASQSQEIDTMTQIDAELEAAGIAVGDLGAPEQTVVITPSMADLEAAEPFDEAFLRMMIPNHASAVAMAEAAVESGQSNEVEIVAEGVIKAQKRELADMRAQLAALN